MRDLKTKIRDDSKEIRKTKKEKCVESQVDSEPGVLSDSPFQEEDCEDLQVDNREENQKFRREELDAGSHGYTMASLDDPRPLLFNFYFIFMFNVFKLSSNL